ncbi:MAG: 5'/3'-nucleotidase SurE, partial [Vicinamibacteria bacterium]
MTTPRILVSNDDGYASEGIRALVDAIAPLGEVWVVAPEAEQSAASHAISIHRPLRLREVRPRWYAVDGTPTDCSWLGINHLMKDRRPDLVVSGINHGGNLADDVTYSGTVAAAMEASIIGVPAIAFSLASRAPFDFTHAACFAARLAGAALGETLPPHMLLNVNVPPGEPAGYAVTRLGRHSYGSDVVEKTDPRGRKY